MKAWRSNSIASAAATEHAAIQQVGPADHRAQTNDERDGGQEATDEPDLSDDWADEKEEHESG